MRTENECKEFVATLTEQGLALKQGYERYEALMNELLGYELEDIKDDKIFRDIEAVTADITAGTNELANKIVSECKKYRHCVPGHATWTFKLLGDAVGGFTNLARQEIITKIIFCWNQ